MTADQSFPGATDRGEVLGGWEMIDYKEPQGNFNGKSNVA